MQYNVLLSVALIHYNFFFVALEIFYKLDTIILVSCAVFPLMKCAFLCFLFVSLKFILSYTNVILPLLFAWLTL